MPLNHIKPHGSLYGMAAREEPSRNGRRRRRRSSSVPLSGMSDTLHETDYRREGGLRRRVLRRSRLWPDGFLIITREHHAVEPAEAARRVLRAMNEGKVRAINGQDFSVRAQSVCVHSDTPGALAVAKAVHEALQPARAAE